MLLRLDEWFRYGLCVMVIGLTLGMGSAQAAGASAAADSATGAEGYKVLAKAWPVRNPDKIEVLVFFAYTCGYCYTFATTQLHGWAVPEDVDFQEIPLNFSNIGQMSRAYHAAVALGIHKQFHPALFDAFQNQRRQFRNKEELATFATQFGVTEAQFIAAYDSFAVNVAMNRADAQAKNYQIASVPTVIVNGKYQTSPAEAGGYAEALQVIERLIQRERALGAGRAPE